MIKILIITLLVLDAGIILLFVLFMRRFVRHDNTESIAMEKLDEILQPSLTEAKSVSYKLETLTREKQQLVQALSDKLDQRIALAREVIAQPARKNVNQHPPQPIEKEKSKNFKEFQDDVLRLSKKGMSTDQVAMRLGVSQNEVDFVLSLRKNMEQARNITAEMEKEDSFQQTDFSTPVKTQRKNPLIKDILQKTASKSSKTKKNEIAFDPKPNADSINADEILKLSKSGMPADNIAKKLGVAKGEVDLVLNLKNKFKTIGQNYNKLTAYK
ncbi:MAG: hypothetical protein OMM_02187 [Candidatus Magnetoglobus multicellularis str. Araruama]|uniref:Uncharacterized protein n=1 Tax=Candidatus Magnetoglobus multicellularis str. Araruama TaxID=890399 RepID=A0A1V1PAH9_9BACT|nr:MAG: hypothetical protein OMM_02187 [Candidatus Magnetoglobus multicellularis str. Araruama]